MDKLHRSMPEKQSLQSEGEELEGLIDGLRAEHNVKEISGWHSGFANLDLALDGILPGLHWLIGPPACGKTSFAKQLLDQVVMNNSVPGIFFGFAERKKELRIKTLARLSGLETREIRRGSAYLLHWYGMPKRADAAAGELPPGWEKLRRSAEEAKPWLDLTYIIECDQITALDQIENQIDMVKEIKARDQLLVVIDDAQRLGARNQPLTHRLSMVAEQLQALAINSNIPILAVWPDLHDTHAALPQVWADRAEADVILVMEPDAERSKKLTEPNQAMTLHIVKNRGGERGKLAFDFSPPFSRFDEPTS
jgi:replicative DNA helicase